MNATPVFIHLQLTPEEADSIIDWIGYADELHDHPFWADIARTLAVALGRVSAAEPSNRTLYKKRYQAYLDSPEWKSLREEVLSRDGHKCATCGSTDKLHVHHLTYVRVFHEKLDDLQTRCANCHTAEHGKTNDGDQ